MSRTALFLAGLLSASAASCSTDQFSAPLTLGGVEVSASTLNNGARTYGRFCASCHGHKGDGDTPAARSLDPRPRDFTRADFKHKSTPGEALPTNADLAQAIRFGVPGTGMPPWPNLSDRQVSALAHYIKVFSPRWRADFSQRTTPGQTMLPATELAASFRLAPPSKRSDTREGTALTPITAHSSSDGGAPGPSQISPPLTAR